MANTVTINSDLSTTPVKITVVDTNPPVYVDFTNNAGQTVYLIGDANWQNLFGNSPVTVPTTGYQLDITQAVTGTDDCGYSVSKTSIGNPGPPDNPSMIVVTGGKE